MPWGEFSELTLLANNAGLMVKGVYDPALTNDRQRVIGDVFIGFLIIQDDSAGNPTVIVDDVAKWQFLPADAAGKYPDWSTIVSGEKVRAAGLKAGDVRAIGTAVQVIDYKPDLPRIPPGVSTFTWCVDQKVAEET